MLNRKRTLSVALLTLFMSICTLVDATPSYGETPPDVEIHNSISDGLEYQELRDFLYQYGVSKDVQNQLILSYQNGERWDSMQPDSIPIDTKTNDLGSSRETIHYYDDGSVRVTTLPVFSQQENSSMTTRAVKECIYTNGGHYGGYWKNCRVDENIGLMRMYFYFDYQNIQDLGPSITAYREGGGIC